MTSSCRRWLLATLLLAGCGGNGSPKYGGPIPPAAAAFGQCALCHTSIATAMLQSPELLSCTVCHDVLTPGSVGPGHMSIPGADRVPSFVGASHSLGGQEVFGTCTYCHNQTAVSLTPHAGEVRCQTCHSDVTVGHYGPGHQTLPGTDIVPDRPAAPHNPGTEAIMGACALCHNHNAINLTPYVAELSCQTCHADTGGGAYGPGHRALPDEDLVPAFAHADHTLGNQTRFGACAYCHNDLGANLNVSGASDLVCTTCHLDALDDMYGDGHRSIPGAELVPSFVGPSHRLGPEAQFGSCGFCHSSNAVKAVSDTHGSLSLACDNCHADLGTGSFGPMHERVTACAECHGSERMTHHDPASGSVFECAVCHDPHGSDNSFLIADFILTPSGTARPIQFNNLDGLADGSFASVTQPGTGLCEVCHTGTRYFRSDASGEPHIRFPCFTCHPHALGFSVRP